MNLDDPRLASAYDETPLWSAPFGLRLLDRVRMAHGMAVLDVGCGAGFPLLELVQRVGPGCRGVGVDPWAAGLRRAREKAAAYGVAGALFVRGFAERLPLPDARFDLAVSNNGLNNVQDLEAALGELRRVLRPGAQLLASMNLPKTMQLFYDAFEATLVAEGLLERVAAMRAHVHAKRRPLAETAGLLTAAGFAIDAQAEDDFRWRFLDGRALFAHAFVRLGFLEAWRGVVAPADAPRVFAALERRLDALARERGGLELEIPFVVFDCRRV